MAVVSAFDDAKRFLFLHPAAPDTDDPVDLLGALVQETKQATDKLTRAHAALKRLRDQNKISDAEYRAALALEDDD